MKPDIKLFKALKEDSDYFTWEKHTHAMMGGTDMGELIDPHYSPPPDEVTSFRNKCRWLYAIFDNLVHTSEGREIIRVHQVTQDGQAVLAELHNTAFSSTASEMKASSLYEEIVTTRISSWTGSAIGFITDYIKKIEEYNYTVPEPGRRLNSQSKKALLERAVEGSRGLKDVKIRELHRIAEGHAPLDYPRYMHLLRETAKQIDKSKAYQRSRRTNVHMTNFDEIDPTDNGMNGESSDPLQVYLANRVPGSRMKGEIWGSLSKDTQGIWDQISDEEKAKIIQGISSNLGNQKNSVKSRTRFKANNHEITDSQETNEGEAVDSNDGNNESESSQEESDTRQANEAKSSGGSKPSSNAHPGDIRRVLGKRGNGKPKETLSIHCAQWQEPIHEYNDSGEDEGYAELGQWGVPEQQTNYGELQHGNHPYSDWNPDEYWKDNQFFHQGDW